MLEVFGVRLFAVGKGKDFDAFPLDGERLYENLDVGVIEA